MDTIDKINYYLVKQGKKGADLSRALGLSSGTYSQWNTRKTKPQKNKLPAIAEYLEVSIEDLLPDSDGEQEKGAKKERPANSETLDRATQNELFRQMVNDTNDMGTLLEMLDTINKKMQELK